MKISQPRILIASPVRQGPDVLQCFLAGLKNLVSETFSLSFLFVDDNVDEKSKLALLSFMDDHPNTIVLPAKQISSPYHVDETTHYWNEELTWKVAKLKDEIIDHALQENYDALFLVDSDIVVHPQTIEQLQKAQVSIVSNIFWTRWQPNTIEMPQVWLQDTYTLYHKGRHEALSAEEQHKRTMDFIHGLRQPGLHEVGGLGACTLIQREALAAGVCFAEIPNISFWGEDRHFCIRAMALGFSLYVDTHYPAYHIYRPSDLPGAQSYLQKTAQHLEPSPPPSEAADQ